jgi:hypothetical protein
VSAESADRVTLVILLRGPSPRTPRGAVDGATPAVAGLDLRWLRSARRWLGLHLLWLGLHLLRLRSDPAVAAARPAVVAVGAAVAGAEAVVAAVSPSVVAGGGTVSVLGVGAFGHALVNPRLWVGGVRFVTLLFCTAVAQRLLRGLIVGFSRLFG